MNHMHLMVTMANKNHVFYPKALKGQKLFVCNAIFWICPLWTNKSTGEESTSPHQVPRGQQLPEQLRPYALCALFCMCGSIEIMAPQYLQPIYFFVINVFVKLVFFHHYIVPSYCICGTMLFSPYCTQRAPQMLANAGPPLDLEKAAPRSAICLVIPKVTSILQHVIV